MKSLLIFLKNYDTIQEDTKCIRDYKIYRRNNMDFFELARSRYSVRRFTDEPVRQEHLDRILEVANEAPTGCNKQPHRIFIAQSEDSINKLNELSRCIFGAKTVFIFALNENEDWKNPLEKGIRAGFQDVSIVATHVMLAAWELGIGTCWVNYFPNSKLDETMGLPEGVKSVLIMPMGYPSEDSEPIPMHYDCKEIKETVRYI